MRKFFLTPLKFTREGMSFVLLTFLLGIAALNTGMNLLYLILAMLLSTITLSGILSDLSLSKVKIRRESPEYAHVGDELEIKAQMVNEKKRFYSFALTWEDIISEGAETIDPDDELRQFVFLIPPMSQLAATYRVLLARRGRLQMEKIRLSTRFPFGLFEKFINIPQESEILIYPQVYPLLRDLEEEWGDAQPRYRQVLSPTTSDHFRSLRDYEVGDPQRRIHWKTSARQGKLMIKEFDVMAPQKVFLLLDTYGSWAEAGERRRRDRELAVSLAASLAVYFQDRNCEVSLITADDRGVVEVESVRGRSNYHQILQALALLEDNGTYGTDQLFAQYRSQPGDLTVGITWRRSWRGTSNHLVAVYGAEDAADLLDLRDRYGEAGDQYG